MPSNPQTQLPPDHITELYRMCLPVLRAKCRRMLSCAADAEDIAQEVFVRLLESDLPSRTGPTSHPLLLAWIYRTSTRAAIDRLRQQHVRSRYHAAPGSAQPQSADSVPEPAQFSASAEALVAARRTIEALARTVPPEELEVVILHRLDRMTQPEIAALTATSERTVRRLLDRFDQRKLALVERGSEEISP